MFTQLPVIWDIVRSIVNLQKGYRLFSGSVNVVANWRLAEMFCCPTGCSEVPRASLGLWFSVGFNHWESPARNWRVGGREVVVFIPLAPFLRLLFSWFSALTKAPLTHNSFCPYSGNCSLPPSPYLFRPRDNGSPLVFNSNILSILVSFTFINRPSYNVSITYQFCESAWLGYGAQFLVKG